MATNLTKLMADTTDLGSSENTKHNKYKKKKKKSTPKVYHIQTAENQRERKSWKKRKKHLTYRGIRIRITLDFLSKIMQARREWCGNKPPT